MLNAVSQFLPNKSLVCLNRIEPNPVYCSHVEQQLVFKSFAVDQDTIAIENQKR